jgi:hypothetical protein
MTLSRVGGGSTGRLLVQVLGSENALAYLQYVQVAYGTSVHIYRGAARLLVPDFLSEKAHCDPSL